MSHRLLHLTLKQIKFIIGKSWLGQSVRTDFHRNYSFGAPFFVNQSNLRLIYTRNVFWAMVLWMPAPSQEPGEMKLVYIITMRSVLHNHKFLVFAIFLLNCRVSSSRIKERGLHLNSHLNFKFLLRNTLTALVDRQ